MLLAIRSFETSETTHPTAQDFDFHTVLYTILLIYGTVFLLSNLLTLLLHSASSYARCLVMVRAVRCWSLCAELHSQFRVSSRGICDKQNDSGLCSPPSHPPPQFLHSSCPHHHSTIIWYFSITSICEVRKTWPDKTLSHSWSSSEAFISDLALGWWQSWGVALIVFEYDVL